MYSIFYLMTAKNKTIRFQPSCFSPLETRWGLSHPSPHQFAFHRQLHKGGGKQYSDHCSIHEYRKR